MTGVNWGALVQSNNALWDRAGRNLDANLQRIQEGEKRRVIAKALQALQGGPNPEALQTIYAIDPQLGMQVEDQLHQRGERQRATTSREAMAEILLGGGPSPQPPMNALAQQLPPQSGPDGSLPGSAVAQHPQMGAPTGPVPLGQQAAPPQSVANPAAPDPLAPLPDAAPDTQQEWTQYLGKLAQWADTPEKWDQAADYFASQGYSDAAQFKGKFSPQARAQLMREGGIAPQAPQQQGYSGAQRRLIEADPEAFLTFQGKRLDVTGKQLKNAVDLNNASMQLLGSVHDQATYDAAKQQALQLYSSFGEDASEFIGGLPAEYSPETIRMLQLRGMDTSKQLAAIMRENNIESQIEVREGRLEEYRRRNRATEANQRRGQDIRSRDTRRGQDVTDKRVRETRGTKGGKGNRSDLIGPVYQKGGRRIQYSRRAGGYVDVATGQPVK